MLTRSNGNIGKSETFTYDDLNRLETSQVGGLTALTMDYSPAGRIESRTDVGSYSYSGTCGGGPNAVKSAAGKTYCYDAAGRMTSRGGNEIGWFSYDSPKWIWNGTASSVFTYGVDRARIRQIRKTGSTTTADIFYIGDLLERDTQGGTTTWRHYVRAIERVVAQVNRVNTTNTAQYLHRDHQNSVVEVTSASGTIVQSLAYDAWGLRRDPSTWAPLPSPFGGTQPTKRGYTGHEHLDNVQLVHMNGRVQDPRLGVFVSPDPFVQAPYHSQSLNRYSYVWNNPVTFADPSGFCTNFEDNVCIQWAMLLSDSFTSAGIGAVESNLTLAASENFALGGFDPSLQVPGPLVIPPVGQQPVLPSTPPQGGSFGPITWSYEDNFAGRMLQSGVAASIGVGFTPAGIYADVYTALSGEDYFTDERVSGFWRAAGVVPLVSELRKGSRVVDAAGAGLFRGGNSLAARLGVDVTQAADGLIHPLGKNGKPQGLSLNVDPKDPFVQRYGGAFPINGLPQGLQAAPSGRPGHFVVGPTTPMTFERYQQLLNQIELGNFNVIP